MTSIASLSGTNYSTDSATKPKSAIDVAAALFGMSKADLTDELKSGKSLNDVAKEKGISTDDLDSALVKNMPPSMASSGDPLAIAQKIAAQVGMPNGPGKGGHDGPPPPSADASSADSSSTDSSGSTSVLDELAKLLKTDTATLKDSLSSGTSLSDLLNQSGVSMSALADTLQQGMLVDTTA
jgi:lambda repressor-like predicted transcriptional regulator